MERKNAVIVAYGRSAIAKAIKGSLRYTGCVDFGSQVLKGILAKNPGFDPALADEVWKSFCSEYFEIAPQAVIDSSIMMAINNAIVFLIEIPLSMIKSTRQATGRSLCKHDSTAALSCQKY